MTAMNLPLPLALPLSLALPLRIARRELREGFAGFRIVVVCLAIGVAAIAGVGSLGLAIEAGIKADARGLLGGDVDLRLHNRNASTAEMGYLRRSAMALSAVTEMRAMARTDVGESKRALIELKAVDEAYPLVGALGTEPARPLADMLARKDGAWGALADPGLLRKLGLGIGDSVRVGRGLFDIRGTIAHEPDEVASIFNLGPRLLVAEGALPDTELIQPGSQFHTHYRVLLSPGSDAKEWMARVDDVLPTAGWRVRGVDQAAPGVERFLSRLTLFLSFAGMTALLVGGIGVANGVKSYLDRKAQTIATMKCLGASSGLVFRAYLAQVGALSAVGIAIGLVVGAVAPILAVMALADVLPVAPRLGLFPRPLLLAAVFGLLTAMTFALWPLARARDVPAASLYRDQIATRRDLPPWPFLLAVALCAAALAGLTLWSASDRYFAAWFVGGAAATLLILRAAAQGILWLAPKLRPLGRATLRLAVAGLYRPGSGTANVVLSLGTGLSVLVAVALIQGNLSRQIDERIPEKAPAYFFIDIQPDQVADFDTAVGAVDGVGDMRRVPILRGRVVKIDGRPVDQVAINPGVQWAVRGDRALTYMAETPQDALIVKGKWWPADYRGPPLISLDANIARGFGVGLGDTVTLNVLGREITGTIASLREIDWRSLRMDFVFIFSPGLLEKAPHTHLAAVQAAVESEPALERAGTEGFPNISAIRVRDALEAAANILKSTSTAVRSTAGISILSGMLVLGGAIAATRRRRVYDSVVFKVLGAPRRLVLTAFLVEYGILGLATGIIAAMVGTATAWAVIVPLMSAEWVWLPGVTAATIVACVVATVSAGFAGTWRALGQKAAPHLRNR